MQILKTLIEVRCDYNIESMLSWSILINNWCGMTKNMYLEGQMVIAVNIRGVVRDGKGYS